MNNSIKLNFDDARPVAGKLEQVSSLIRRWVLPNPGPFTCTGTCCYVVGHRHVTVIDPGPGRAGEIEALLAALGQAQVAQIVITHTHRDHSPGARELSALTGAPIVGCGPHVAARKLNLGERNLLDASADHDHAPVRILRDGDVLEGAGFTLHAVETPGHTMNHLAFACPQENALFSGDHVMAWSTTIVAPPDGAMGAYMASLEKLRGRSETVYWPGHGGPVKDPQRYLRAIIGHRKMRESTIVAALDERPASITTLVERLYEGLAPALKGAAALSVFAHLEDLAGRGLVQADGELTLEAIYAKR
jgi:glyoxylase-like metal-dependent hydrolase (beta-lactamase superfamily II)